MKKIVFTIFSLFLTLDVVYAFDIDVSKIDINAKDNTVIKNLDMSYKIDTSSFNNNISINNDIKDVTKELVKISLSDDKDNKLKELTKYLYISSTSGSTTLTGSLFLTDFVNKINENNYSYDYIKNIRTVDIDNGTLVFVYIDDVKVNDSNSDMVLAYWLINTNQGYKLHFAWFNTDKDLEMYFNSLGNNEKNNIAINQVYKSYSFNDNKKEVSDNELTNIYENNKLSNVSITGMKNNGISTFGSGFFLRSGVVVTSWELFLNLLNDSNFIYINDCNGNTYNVDGVIAADTKYDVVILKINKDAGKGIKIGNSNDLKTDDNIFMINSLDNNSFSIKTGSYVNSSEGKMKNMLPINSSSIGAALYNSNGEVVGFNTGTLLDSELSYANSSNYLIDIYNILNNTDYSMINYTKLNDFKNNYYNKYNKENIYNNISNNIWNIYKKIGNLEDNINLELIKGCYTDNILSLRYKNDIKDSINSMYLVSNYEDELINQGYELIMDSNSKKIYKNDNYEVVIKNNMNYIIIIIMEI